MKSIQHLVMVLVAKAETKLKAARADHPDWPLLDKKPASGKNNIRPN